MVICPVNQNAAALLASSAMHVGKMVPTDDFKRRHDIHSNTNQANLTGRAGLLASDANDDDDMLKFES